jgi:threonine aldolase
LFNSLQDIESLKLATAPDANSMFPIINKPEREILQSWAHFYDWDTSINQVRWMTAWDVETAEIEAFAAGVREVLD